MKPAALSYFFFMLLLLISCQREVDNIPVTPVGPVETDSTPAGSLIRFVSINPRNDSIVSNYQYNAKGSLTKAWSNDNIAAGYSKYIRDDKERLIRVESISPKGSSPEGNYGGSNVTEIYYSDNTSGMVSYSVYYNLDSSDKRLDSILYFYENNRLSKAFIYNRLDGKLIADYVYTYSYDEKGNVTKMNGYKPNVDGTITFNIGYEFEFDDHPKPYNFNDDAMKVWSAYALSANNIVKQTNHYEDPAQTDPPVVLQYTYGADGRPITSTQSGAQVETSRFSYYYK